MSGAGEETPEGAGGSAGYREASILFADIVGFGALARARGADEAYLVVTRCLRILDDVARRHGGAVDKYLGDCLMAVFGFPLTPPEAAAAAARAALEMRLSVREVAERLELPVDLDVKVGIEAGPILAGALGDSVVREFSVLGRSVNHAARIKSLAPAGAVYAGAGLVDLLGDRFVMREVGAVKLEGVRDLARPREILEAQRDDDAPFGAEVASYAPFVGREAELAQLDARVLRQAAGEGGLVSVEGPPGAGKSRLLLELTQRHPERRIRSLPPAGSRALSDEGGIFVVDDVGRRPDLAAALAGLRPSTLVFLVGRAPLPETVAKAIERARTMGEDPLELALGPLDDAAIGALVDALPERVLEPEARALVVRRAAGNPGRAIQSAFLAETLRADEARAPDYRERADDAERRRATVVFADLSGFTALAETMDAGALHPLVSDCLDRLSEIARGHGGTVEKYLGDCVMAVFGVPVSIEDAPRAAINASIEMRQAVASFNEERGLVSPFGIHIGIDTGLGIAGEVSGPLIREYSLMGESVSGAARLEDLSPPGSILVGEETFRATREDFDYAPVDTSDGPVAYELRSQATKLHRTSPSSPGRVRSVLVGRSEELAALDRATRELAAGSGGVVSIVAEAGIGKSRLLAEALPPETSGFRWLKGRSLSNGRSLGHHPFADLFARWCGAEEDEAKDALAEKLARTATAALGSEAEEVLPFLSTLLGAPLPERERERMERLAPEALEPLLLAAITRTLRGMARREPVALVFEDLHWADASSIELLTSLLRLSESEPILFLLVTRPGWPETAGRVLAAARDRLARIYTEIALEPLDADASMELLRNLFRGADVPHALRTAIEQRATGNPFYAEEVVRGLRDAGALEDRDGRLVATPAIHEVAVPGTLQEVVMARVDRLGREGREILRVASAIGFGFAGDVLADVEGRAVEDDLARLEASEMVERRDGRPGEFRFKHPLIQEVVYDSMLEARRSELHGRVGRAVEARLRGDEPGAHAMLAHHFSRAGDLERAERHLFAAGDEAARTAASDEALHFFEDAAALFRELHGDEGDPQKLGLLERNMALALVNRGRYAEAIEHFDMALRCHGVVRAERPLRRNLRLVRDLALILGRLYLRRANPRRGATETERQIQELVYERARAQTTNATDRYLFDWMDAVRRLGDVDPRTLPLAGGQFASSVGIFSFGGVSFAISERFLAQALELVDDDDPEERMIYGMMNATHQTLAGDWSEAHELPVEFIEDRIRDGQLFDVTNYLGLRTERRIMQGRFEDARAGIARLAHVAELFQFEQARATVRALETFLALEEEEWERAIEAAEAHFSQHPDPLPNLLALGNKAKAQLGLGRRDEAERSLTAAESLLAEATSFVPPFHKAVVLRSRLLCEVEALAEGRGHRPLARRVARQALRAGGWVALRRPEIQRLEGTRRSLVGDARGARRWWRRARAEAEALGMIPEVERADRALATGAPAGPKG